MANPTGYMDKEKAESEKKHQEYMAWLKSAQAESRKIHKNFQTELWMDWPQRRETTIRAS